MRYDFVIHNMNKLYDRQQEMAPIVSDTAEPDEDQGHPTEVNVACLGKLCRLDW